MRKIGQFLTKAVTYDSALRTARAQAAMRDWQGIVGEALAKRSRPDRYGNGTVWVAVTGSAWAQEMRMRKDLILRRLRERAGDDTLFIDVRFGVRPLPTAEIVVQEPSKAFTDEEVEGLSIREIAQRRLKMLRDSNG